MSGATKLMTAGGGGVNIQPASSIASDVTVNVPSQNCTLGIQGPAFSAYPSFNQSITTNTWTKIALQTEEFDTASAFDNTTNYRFQPLIAGYYQINGAVYPNTTTTLVTAAIYKNGANYKAVQQAANSVGIECSVLIYFNGSTDYIELYTFVTGISPVIFGSGTYTFLNGSMVRAA
jgi:hypothetical protein